MASWSWRTGGSQRDGLTLYQVQELVRSGQAGSEDLVRVDDGPWRRVQEEPRLARLLPGDVPDPARTRVVGGLVLQVDEDGRLMPPTPEQIAQALAGSTPSDPLVSSAAMVRKGAYVLAALIFVASAAIVVALLLR